MSDAFDLVRLLNYATDDALDILGRAKILRRRIDAMQRTQAAEPAILSALAHCDGIIAAMRTCEAAYSQHLTAIRTAAAQPEE